MWYCRTRSVGVGSPNPLGEETSPPQWIPRPKPQRGDMYSLSESQIQAQETEKQLPRERDSVLSKERYVYSSATRPIPALSSAMWYFRRGWVPNPLGETSPPRWIPRRQLF